MAGKRTRGQQTTGPAADDCEPRKAGSWGCEEEPIWQRYPGAQTATLPWRTEQRAGGKGLAEAGNDWGDMSPRELAWPQTHTYLTTVADQRCQNAHTTSVAMVT